MTSRPLFHVELKHDWRLVRARPGEILARVEEATRRAVNKAGEASHMHTRAALSDFLNVGGQGGKWGLRSREIRRKAGKRDMRYRAFFKVRRFPIDASGRGSAKRGRPKWRAYQGKGRNRFKFAPPRFGKRGGGRMAALGELEFSQYGKRIRLGNVFRSGPGGSAPGSGGNFRLLIRPRGGKPRSERVHGASLKRGYRAGGARGRRIHMSASAVRRIFSVEFRRQLRFLAKTGWRPISRYERLVMQIAESKMRAGMISESDFASLAAEFGR